MLDSVVTQKTFAELIGVSEAAVSQFIAEGILPRDATLREWCRTYCARLREQAAGRAATGDLDLATERARLAREQADRIAMQNAVTRRELAPVGLLEQILARTAARVVAILDGIAPAIKRRLPDLPSAEYQAIQLEVAKARNEAGIMTLADLDLDDPAPDEPLTEADA